MAKKIAVIQDLSGFGKCSLTAAIPVLSVMGVQACPLPTAILSAQTGYPSYYLDDYTDKMEYFRSEWEKAGASFDGIYTGFVAGEAQVEHILKFLDTFYRGDCFLLVDPVLGDDGVRYDMYTDGLLVRMKELVSRADILTPNLTELCFLTGADYRAVQELSGQLKLEVIRQMSESLLKQGVKHMVVTGVRDSGKSGRRIGNVVIDGDGLQMIDFPDVGGSFSGTGDLFASVIAGGMARGEKLDQTVRLAGAFVEASMKDAVAERNEAVAGTEFERHLGMLLY